MTCDEADRLAAGLALLGHRSAAIDFLREHSRMDTEAGDPADRHAGLSDDALDGAIDLAVTAARTRTSR